MFKKFLCWLLIFQHINVYVLHATPGDIKVLFEREDEHHLASQQGKPSALHLSILKEGSQGQMAPLFQGTFETDPNSPLTFNLKQSLPKSLEGFEVKLGLDNQSLHLSSTLEGEAFSLHLNPDGKVNLQEINCLRYLGIHTFGDIHTQRKIEAKELSLEGREIRTSVPLFVEKFHVSGALKNTSEGQLYIGKEAHIRDGNFVNEGRIWGSDQSFLDLYGNNFTNENITQKKFLAPDQSNTPHRYTSGKKRYSFQTQIMGAGRFSIRGVGTFLNKSLILPEEGKKDVSLTIEAKELHNTGQGLIASEDLTLRCLGNLLNEGEMRGITDLTLDVKGNLENRSKIESLGSLRADVLGNLMNRRGATFTGERLILNVEGLNLNEGRLSARFALIKGKLENFGGITIEEEGEIDSGDGDLINRDTAHIMSHGVLRLYGQSLLNERGPSSRALIDARHLMMKVGHVHNDGEVIARESANLHFPLFVNGPLGIWNLPGSTQTSTDNFKNHESVYSENLQMTAGVFENFGRIISAGIFTIIVEEAFRNVKDALLSAFQGIFLKGQGKVHNQGIVASHGKVEIEAAQTLNQGQILSDEGVGIRTEGGRRSDPNNIPDFMNEGLILSPDISVDVQKGLNKGDGLIAKRSLTLTAHDTFINESSALGGTSIDLLGEGIFTNARTLISQGILRSQVRHLENIGHILAKTGILEGSSLHHTGSLHLEDASRVTFKDIQVSEGASMTSQGGLHFQFSRLDNKGEIETGEVTIFEGQHLKNEGEIQSAVLQARGLLGHESTFLNRGVFHGVQNVRITTSEIENQNEISSDGSVTVDVSKSFLNSADGVVASSKDLIISGDGKVKNYGSLESDGQVSLAMLQVDNRGAIIADESVMIRTGGDGSKSEGDLDFMNEGAILSPEIILRSHTGFNGGEGLIAKRSLTLTAHRTFTNHGDIFGGKSVDLLGKGTFTNTKILASQGELNSEVRHLENTGDIQAQTGILKGDSLHHAGSMHLHEPSGIAFKNIETSEESSVTSQGGIRFGFSTFDNKGRILTEGETSFTGQGLRNQGEVQASLLQVRDGTGAENIFSNDGVFHGYQGVTVTASHVENQDEISSQGSLFLDIRKSFTNALGALVSSLKEMVVSGKGDVQNHGDMESQTSIDIATSTTQNKGRVIAEESVSIHTKKTTLPTGEKQKDFENDGLVMSSHVTVHSDTGLNAGSVNYSIDANSDDLQGLIATDRLTLLVGNKFTNHGQMVGGSLVNLEGDGTFDNEGDIHKSDLIESRLQGFDNKGVARAHHSVSFDQLMQDLKNKGLILSEGRVSINSTSRVLNEGVIEGRDGETSLRAEELENRGLLSALGSPLVVTATQAKNHHLIFGKKGVDLTIGKIFTNENGEDSAFGRVESHGSLTVQGKGSVHNKGSIASQGDADIRTDLDNEGILRSAHDVVFSASDKALTNTGEILADETVRIATERPLENTGLVQGQETSLAALGTFHNAGEILATNGQALLTLGEGLNKGRVIGSEGVDITVVKTLTNQGHVLSPGSTVFHGTGSLENSESGVLMGDKSLDISNLALENKGLFGSARDLALHHLQGPLQNTASIISQGSIRIAETASVHNSGHIQGTTHTAVVVKELDNKGEISSLEGSVDLIVQKGANREGSVIVARTNLAVNAQTAFVNNGVMSGEASTTLNGERFTNHNLLQSRGALKVDLQSLTNHKEILAKEADFSLHTLENARDIFIGDDLRLDVQQGVNAGDIQAQTLTLDVRAPVSSTDQFHNKKTLYASSHLALQGKGMVSNESDILSEGTLEVHSKALINGEKGQLQATRGINISSTTHVENAFGAKILSQSTIEVGREASVTNQGLISGKSLVFQQPSYTVSGRLEAKGDITFPHIQTLHTSKGSSLYTEEGQIVLPQVQVVDHAGSLLSQKSISLPNLLSFKNNGSFQSNGEVTLVSSGELANHHRIVGRSGVSLKAQKVSNQGGVVSEDTITIQSPQIDNSRLIVGAKGVKVVSSQPIVQGQTGRMESRGGYLRLECPEFKGAGEFVAKKVEIHSTGKKPFSLDGIQIKSLEDLALTVSYGWDLKGKAQSFGHGIHLTGPLLNPSHLTIDGDFIWDHAGGDLQNKFNMIVAGLLSLRLKGQWINLADVQARGGAAVVATQILNKGTFYSYASTSFECPKGFENYHQLEVWGDMNLLASQGSIVNYPGSHFHQKTIPGGKNHVVFKALQDIKDISGTVVIEGVLDSTSKVFSNEVAPPTQQNGTKIIIFKGQNTSVPATREVPAPPARFYAGSANVRAESLQNLGGTLSTSDGFYFEGNKVKNLSRTYKEVSQKEHSWTEKKRKRWYKKKKRITKYELIPSTTVIDDLTSVAKLYSRGVLKLVVNGTVFEKTFPKQKEESTQRRIRRKRQGEDPFKALVENTGDIRASLLTMNVREYLINCVSSDNVMIILKEGLTDGSREERDLI
ncbi:MAG: hypothetical protein J0H87_08620 [Holosporales bacterium]|nr:hypothetical protein [Holosporales bacterium]